MVTEHENTIKILRDDYIEQLRELCIKRLELNPELYQSIYDLEIFESATTLQIRGLLRLASGCDEKCNLKVVRKPVGSDPYLAVTFRGLYVGIEPDGYTHS